MRFEVLLEIANPNYPDDELVSHWDSERQQPVGENDERDALARFIVRKLHGLFDPDAADIDQLETAVGAMERAFVELGRVRVGLMAEFLKRRRWGV